MKNSILNEINEMKYMFGYKRGVVISEQAASETQTATVDVDCETNKKALVDYLTTNGFKQQDKYYTRQLGDKVLAILPNDNGEVRFYVALDTKIDTNNIPNGFYESSFATYSRVDDTPSFKSLGPYFGKDYTYQYESEQTPNRTYCNSGLAGTKPFNESTLKGAIDTLIKKLT